MLEPPNQLAVFLWRKKSRSRLWNAIIDLTSRWTRHQPRKFHSILFKIRQKSTGPYTYGRLPLYFGMQDVSDHVMVDFSHQPSTKLKKKTLNFIADSNCYTGFGMEGIDEGHGLYPVYCKKSPFVSLTRSSYSGWNWNRNEHNGRNGDKKNTLRYKASQ